MDSRPKQAFAAGAGITAGIADDPHLHGEQTTVGIGRHLVFQVHRVPLDVMLRRLFTRQRRLHRAAEEKRGHRGLRLDRQLFLRAERAAARGEGDFDVGLGQLQHSRDRLLVELRALALAMNLDARPLRVRKA
jgi:hypothetical protein